MKRNPTTQRLLPSRPVPADRLQPLREVGTMEKTQFWDFDEIMEALRLANRHGIPIKDLRSRSNPPVHPVRKAS